MTEREDLIQRAEALAKAHTELNKHAEAAIAAIEAAEARRAAEHKKVIGALDAILEVLDTFSGKLVVTKGDAK